MIFVSMNEALEKISGGGKSLVRGLPATVEGSKFQPSISTPASSSCRRGALRFSVSLALVLPPPRAPRADSSFPSRAAPSPAPTRLPPPLSLAIQLC